MFDDCLPWKYKSLGFPFLKIENLSNFRFMVFDRYEIQIQALVVFSSWKCSIFQSSSSYFFKICIQNVYIKYISKKSMFKKYIRRPTSNVQRLINIILG